MTTAEQALESLNDMADWLRAVSSGHEPIDRRADTLRQHIESTAAELEALRASTASVQADQRAENDRLRGEVEELRKDAERLRAASNVVNEQAENDGLWFIPDSVVEAFFQQELRRLHAAIEGDAALTQGGAG